MTFNLLSWRITIENKNKKYIIDDLFKVLPTTDPFDVEPLLEQILKSRGEFKSRDVWFLSSVGIIEQELLTYNLVIKQGNRLVLTDSGRLAKDLGGLTEHLKYKKLQLTSVKSQNTVNNWLLIIAGLSILLPFVTEWYKYKFFNETPYKEPVHIVVDSISITQPRQVEQKIDTVSRQEKSIK